MSSQIREARAARTAAATTATETAAAATTRSAAAAATATADSETTDRDYEHVTAGLADHREAAATTAFQDQLSRG